MTSSTQSHNQTSGAEEVDRSNGPPPSTSGPRQRWTSDGYPIVDGKYHDLATNEIKAHSGPGHCGPPTLSVYWHSRGSTVAPEDRFYAVGAYNGLTVTEYIVRMGDMLREGPCTIASLNVTNYAVNVIVETELPRSEFTDRLRRHGLLTGP